MMSRHSVARFFALGAWLQRYCPLPPSCRARRSVSALLARAFLARLIGPLQCRFEGLLGETSDAARALVYDWFFYKQLESGSWAEDESSHPDSVLLDAPRVAQYLHSSDRGVVIATIHMGDYLGGLRQLRLALPKDKRIFVVRRQEWSDIEQRAFTRIVGRGGSLTVLRRGGRLVATAIRELRRGAVLVVLFDLPVRYGRTVEVDFFGHTANFVRGPAELALAGNADVLPLFCHYESDGSPIAQVLPILVGSRIATVDRTARVATLTQQLCSLAEQQIRRYPSQWAHWEMLDEFGLTSKRQQSDATVISLRR